MLCLHISDCGSAHVMHVLFMNAEHTVKVIEKNLCQTICEHELELIFDYWLVCVRRHDVKTMDMCFFSYIRYVD